LDITTDLSMKLCVFRFWSLVSMQRR